jgi:outer membrane protein
MKGFCGGARGQFSRKEPPWPPEAIIMMKKRYLIIVLIMLVCFSGFITAEKLTLDRALEIAFEKSPSIREAALKLETGEHNLKAQQASLKSQFNLTLTPLDISDSRVFNELTSAYNTQERTKSEATFSITQPIKWTDGTLSIIEKFNWQEASSSFTGSEKEAYFSNSLYFRFSQPLFTYNRTKLRTRELEMALESARLNYAIRKLQIENQVTQQFLDLYYYRQSIDIAAEELKNSTESYQIIESKVDAGISASEELYQADLTRANSRSALESSQIQYENAMDNFKILLGLPFDRELEIEADIGKSLKEVDLAWAIDHGLKYRMELRQYDINIENALNDLIRAAAENEFKASVDVSFGFTGTSKRFGDIYQSPNKDKLIAVSVNIPIFDWGKKKHQVAASKAQVESTRLTAREERRQIQYEIRQAFRNLRLQETKIEIAEKNVKNARLTYEINLERYKSGDLSSKDMQFYQLQLSEEQLKKVQALINYKLALLDLKIRTLWDFEKNKSIIE